MIAMILGMIPDCDLALVTSAGNAAGTGAGIALLNVAARSPRPRYLPCSHDMPAMRAHALNISPLQLIFYVIGRKSSYTTRRLPMIARTDLTTEFAPNPSILARLWTSVSAAAASMAHYGGPAQCAREAERLFALSDAELARLGLTRDRVIHHAFARYLGL
jgi:hypothetical protein